MKSLIIIGMLLSLLMASAMAVEDSDASYAQARELIAQKVSCEKLSSAQLASIGDYYMEQFHPGDAHELMDRMMGGEGSPQLDAVHIAMAQRWYCEDTRYGTMGMMPMGMMGTWNRQGGMMNMMWGYGAGEAGTGMMTFGWGLWWIVSWLIGIGLAVLVWLWVIKLWKETRGHKRK